MITPTMTVADVLATYPQTLTVFVEQHSAFKRLENPLMRKTFARLVTLEQAAGIARIDLKAFIAALNTCIDTGTVATLDSQPAVSTSAAPAWYDPRRIAMTVDVRQKEAHESPLALIMQAFKQLPDGAILYVRNSFEPLPLYEVVRRWGIQYWAYCTAPDDWHVFFYGRPPYGSQASHTESTPAPIPATTVLDHRGLAPPEPMMRTLAALKTLPKGASLVLLTDRQPVFLYEALDDQGYTYQNLPMTEQGVRTLITHSH